LQKLGIAPKNESYIISILKFIKVLDQEGKRTPKGTAIFLQDDEGFQKGLRDLVKDAYSELFKLHGDQAWTLEMPKLVSFFRTTDQTSDVVGKRQAGVFLALAQLSGHGSTPAAKALASSSSKKNNASAKKVKPAANKGGDAEPIVAPIPDGGGVGLTVRIEINLPAADNQKTYDMIFKSIRENLLRG
jgi:hypothetical protein